MQILQCPNCNAQIHIRNNKAICAYCGTEFILDNNNEKEIFEEISSKPKINYEKSLAFWKEQVNKTTKIEAIAMAFSAFLFTINVDNLATLIFMSCIVITISMAVRLSKSRPYPPTDPPITKIKLLNGIMLYLRFCGAFWGGFLTTAVILGMLGL